MNPAPLQVSIDNDVPPLHVEHTFPAGGTTAVVGPNGAGKTTLLRVIAGLIDARPESTIRLGDNSFAETRRYVPAHRRGVALLGQEARLFPHLSVRANVAFAPAAQHLRRAEVRARVNRWLAAVEVADLADRKPHQLSGGQAQRVAIARALAAQPPILLLDEPFRALDVDVAGRLRGLLRELLADRSRTTIIVTHDVVDAVGIADEIMVLDGGRVVESGPTRSVLAAPRSRFAATLSGLNLFIGRMADRCVVDEQGRRVAGTLAEGLADGTAAAAAFSPRAVDVYLKAPHDVPRTVLRARIEDVTPRGDHALIGTGVGGQKLTAEVAWDAVADLELRPGLDVDLVVKASEVSIHAVLES